MTKSVSYAITNVNFYDSHNMKILRALVLTSCTTLAGASVSVASDLPPQCKSEVNVLRAAVDLGTYCDAKSPTLFTAKCIQPMPLSDSALLYQDCCACTELTCDKVAADMFAKQGGTVNDMCRVMVDGSEYCTNEYSFGPQKLRDCCPNACGDPCVVYAQDNFDKPSVHAMCVKIAASTSHIKTYCEDSLMSLNDRRVAECCPVACRGTCENYAIDHYTNGTVDAMCADIEQTGGYQHDLCGKKVVSNSHKFGKDCCPEACSSPCEKFARDHFQNKTVHLMCLDIEEYGGYRHSACSEKIIGDATVADECCLESCRSPCAGYAYDHFNEKSVEGMCSEIATVGHKHEACPAHIGLTTHTIGKDCCVEACTSPCDTYAAQNFDGASSHAMCLAIEAGGGHNNEACTASVGGSTLAKECCAMACRTTCEIYAANTFENKSVAEMCQIIEHNGGHDHEVCETVAGLHTHILGKDCCPEQCRDACENYAFDNYSGGGVHEMCLAIEESGDDICEKDIGGWKTVKDCCPVVCRSDCENHAVDHFGKGSVKEMCDEISQNGGHTHESCGKLEGAKTPSLGIDCCPMACRTPCEGYAVQNFDNKNLGEMCDDILAHGGHQHKACQAPVNNSTVGEECCREACDRNACETVGFENFQVDSVVEMCTIIAGGGGFENAACFADVVAGEIKVRDQCCVEECRTPCEKHAFARFNGGTVEEMCNQVEGTGRYKSDICSESVIDSTVGQECCVTSCHTPCETYAYEFFANSTVDDMCIAIEGDGGHDNSACNDVVSSEDGDAKVGEQCCFKACQTPCEAFAANNFEGSKVVDMCLTIEKEGSHSNPACDATVGNSTVRESCCVQGCRTHCEQFAFDQYGEHTLEGMCLAILKNGGYKDTFACPHVIGSSILSKECCVSECSNPCEGYAINNFTGVSSIDGMCDAIANTGGYLNKACSVSLGDYLLSEQCCKEACLNPCEQYALDRLNLGSANDLCTFIHYKGGHASEHCLAPIGQSTVAEACCPEPCRSPCESYALEHFNGMKLDQMCTTIAEAGGHDNAACADAVGSSTVGEECCLSCAQLEDASRQRGLRRRFRDFFN